MCRLKGSFLFSLTRISLVKRSITWSSTFSQKLSSRTRVEQRKRWAFQISKTVVYEYHRCSCSTLIGQRRINYTSHKIKALDQEHIYLRLTFDHFLILLYSIATSKIWPRRRQLESHMFPPFMRSSMGHFSGRPIAGGGRGTKMIRTIV